MSLSPTGAVSPLVCPRCNQPMSADDVNIELLVGICRHCDATVELTRDGLRDKDAAYRDSPPAELLAAAGPPDGVSATETGGKLVLTRRWFSLSPTLLFLGLWCLMWDGFLVVWYSAGIGMMLSGSPEALVMLLFPVLHVAVGIGMTYFLIASVLNRSTIVIDEAHITVTHGPLPWFAPDPIPVRSVDQLYLVRQTGKNASGFELVARRVDRTSEQLLGRIASDAQARWIEQRLEAWLGLADQPVEGEYNG